MQENKIELRRIDAKTSLLLALKQMDQIDKKLLFVFDTEKI